MQPTPGDRLPEIVDYALRVCGSEAGVRTSQRELARHLLVAPGMVGRYASGQVSFDHLKASTVYLLAQAARLHVGTLFVWNREGQEAAMDYEHRLSNGTDSSAGLRPLELAELLVSKLRQQALLQEQAAATPQMDWAGLDALIAQQQQPSPELFERLVAALGAQDALDAVAQRQELSDQHWTLLRQLLAVEDTAFRQRFELQSSRIDQAAA